MKQQWKLWEEIDGCYVFPANADPDDLSFGRIKPVAKILDSDESTRFIQYLARLPAFNACKKRESQSAIDKRLAAGLQATVNFIATDKSSCKPL